MLLALSQGVFTFSCITSSFLNLLYDEFVLQPTFLLDGDFLPFFLFLYEICPACIPVAMATDTAGNQNWAEVTINVPFVSATARTSAEESPKYRVAFVQPSFTEGAYNVGGFYTFYPKYASTAAQVNVTADLKNLTAVVPEVLANEKYYGPLTQHIKKMSPDAVVSIIRDEDVHNGYIFGQDGSNAYDTLFLLHDEYATSNSYDNLRNFVANGGTIVFLDGNVFYSQVNYNKKAYSNSS